MGLDMPVICVLQTNFTNNYSSSLTVVTNESPIKFPIKATVFDIAWGRDTFLYIVKKFGKIS